MESSDSVALCCVVGGEVYERYALGLRNSFFKHFFPSAKQSHFFMIPGDEGWPNGTMYRWHHLLENMPETSYVFLCDADMRFENLVTHEILSDCMTLTLHPGYVGIDKENLPYERRANSACYVPPQDGMFYFCGGFAGGPRKIVKEFANEVCSRIDSDMSQGLVPVWHDESALNRTAVYSYNLHVLSPSYCYPDNDTYYREHIWKTQYERKLVALDKEEGERAGR